MDVLGPIYEGLTTKDGVTQETVGALAESWEVSSDQKSVVFHLRRGVCWNDGHPFTADDVLFTYNDLIYNEAIPNRYLLTLSVDGKPFRVTKVDDHTVRFDLPDIFAPFLEFAGMVILPKHKLEASVKDGSFSKMLGIDTPPDQVVGTGPFRLRTYQPGQRTVFERNPYYWKLSPDGKRLPYLDHYIAEIVRDQNALFIHFISGKSDVLEGIRPEDVYLAKKLAPAQRYRVVERGPASSTSFLWFNMNPGTDPQTGKPLVAPAKLRWFRETRFRQAVSYALDRQGIIDSVFMGMAQPLWTCESPTNIRWYNPAVRQYPRDIARARDLLQQAGFRWDAEGNLQDSEGVPVSFEIVTNQGNDTRANIATIIKDNLKELGMQVRIQFLDFNNLVARIGENYQYEACILGLSGGADDPTSAMSVLLSSGRMHQWYPNQKSPATPWEARIDELMNAQVKTLDYAARKRAYDEVQIIMAEQQPYIYLVTPVVHTGLKERWQNVRPPASSGSSMLWNVEEVWSQ